MTKKEQEAQETLGGTTVYVVTRPELGWDCVCGVYFSEESAKMECENEDGEEDDSYVIHEQTIY